MDPLSLTTACLALLGAVTKTSVAVTTFVRGCREARSDLTSISGELTQLQLVLDLLKDDASVSDRRAIPESLQTQILSIISNCSLVVDNINTVLQNHSGKAGAVKWVTFGKSQVAGLRMSLEAHRGSLGLVLELVSVSMSRAILEDVAVVRDDVHDIKHDTSQIPQIMAELTRLRAMVAAGETSPRTKGQNYVLEQYLDSLTSYAETVCNDVVWDDPGRSTHTLSRKPSAEGVGDPSGQSGRGAAKLPTEPSDETGNCGSSQFSTTETTTVRLESSVLETTLSLRAAAPSLLILQCHELTSTGLVLWWNPIPLAAGDLIRLVLYCDGQKLTDLPNRLSITGVKVSNLDADTEYTFHLEVLTTVGTLTSQRVTVRTPKMAASGQEPVPPIFTTERKASHASNQTCLLVTGSQHKSAPPPAIPPISEFPAAAITKPFSRYAKKRRVLIVGDGNLTGGLFRYVLIERQVLRAMWRALHITGFQNADPLAFFNRSFSVATGDAVRKRQIVLPEAPYRRFSLY